MKVIYVDIETDGHHLTYLRALTNINNKENILVLPQKLPDFDNKQYVFSKMDFYNKKLGAYLRWIKEIKKIIKKEQPDVVHFLYGDVFYKYFGLGLEGLKRKYKVINTVHALKKGKIGMLSLKRIFRLSSMGVVHTDAIYNAITKGGITNISHVEYPQFSFGYYIDVETARKYYSIAKESFVLGCIGGTRYDKGLDILLRALQSVEGNFELLVAGKECEIKKDEIQRLSASYKERVHLYLNYLSDEELEMAFQAVDVIVLPYRKTFNGASGPLGEGVGKEKMIIGTNYGSIGDIISKNHLGYTFEAENVENLKQVINRVLGFQFNYDLKAMTYKKSLSVEYFKDKYKKVYGM
ncbi:glycosyltransferase [Eisenbergiella massiliensis]|uniref:Glycosyltransferase n=1 Tax=Eisenbergiella massiliensis TaxID=1720294 RepID=A0A3E3I0D1_9FIRM|nr:glycosyltransferase [Eisenbergiella massiliensis]RGE57667.1 glycosyltransferase [Eisenbergiella massiliensis]